jgi:hypothetical protein
MPDNAGNAARDAMHGRQQRPTGQRRGRQNQDIQLNQRLKKHRHLV